MFSFFFFLFFLQLAGLAERFKALRFVSMSEVAVSSPSSGRETDGSLGQIVLIGNVLQRRQKQNGRTTQMAVVK
jgi:hypothetical protein